MRIADWQVRRAAAVGSKRNVPCDAKVEEFEGYWLVSWVVGEEDAPQDGMEIGDRVEIKVPIKFATERLERLWKSAKSKPALRN